MFAVSGQTSIGAAYNRILASVRPSEVDALILQHDDLEITDPNAEERFIDALHDPEVALVGVAGGSARGGLAWWDHSPVGHQQIEGWLIDFGDREGPVELIEGSIMVFAPWVIGRMWFNETPGFHGYDEIAYRMHRLFEAKIVVIDVATYHHTHVGFKSVEDGVEWREHDRRFKERWGIS
jgi:hypothetical protein